MPRNILPPRTLTPFVFDTTAENSTNPPWNSSYYAVLSAEELASLERPERPHISEAGDLRAPWAHGPRPTGLMLPLSRHHATGATDVPLTDGKLPSYASLPLNVLTPLQREDACCCISLKNLCGEGPLIEEPIGVWVGQALHVFEWASLNQWLRSSQYRCADRLRYFVNPYNKQPTVWGALFRLEPESELRR